MVRWMAAFGVVAVLGGCATVQPPDEFAHFLQTAPLQGPARAADAVAVYRDGAPPVPYHEIGILSGRGLTYMTTLHLVRKLAGENGCDAIGHLVETVSPDTETVWGYGIETWDVYHLTASCLVLDRPRAAGTAFQRL